jgi:septum formation protein
VYLASASPRRRELLAQIGVEFQLLAVEVDEQRAPGEPPVEYVQRVALAKARAGRRLIEPREDPVLAADTAVIFGAEVFGKPSSESHARIMLRALSNATHEVLSGVALVGSRGEATAVSRSEVSFRALTADEIDAYWQTGEPRDKAGAYAIQGRGAIFVRELRGSYSGVMGLPLFETAELLRAFGISVVDGAVMSS